MFASPSENLSPPFRLSRLIKSHINTSRSLFDFTYPAPCPNQRANMSSIGEIITEIKELIAYVGVVRLVTVRITPNSSTPQANTYRSTLMVGSCEPSWEETNFNRQLLQHQCSCTTTS